MRKLLIIICSIFLLLGYVQPIQVHANTSIVNEYDEIELLNILESRAKLALLNNESVVDISDLNISKDNKVISSLSDYSPYFSNGIDCKVYYSNDIYVQIRLTNTLSDDEVLERISNIDDILISITSLAEGYDDFHKALIIHDYLAFEYEYDYEFRHVGSRDSYKSGGLFLNKTAVCQGYGYAYMYLMNLLGVECHYVSSSEINHGWNIIEIDDSYYHVDVTWDDPVLDRFGMVNHDNFLLSDSKIQENEHMNWDGNYLCDNNQYDNAFWKNVSSNVVIDNGYYYYANNNQLLKHNIETNEIEKLYDLGYWLSDGGYYIGTFVSVFKEGRLLYFNTYDKIYTYNLDTGEVKLKLEYNNQGQVGGIYGIKEKEGYLWYSYQKSPNEVKNIFKTSIEVKKDVKKVVLDKTVAKVDIDNTLQLTAKVYPIDASNDVTLTWSSSNPEIASVDQNGVVYGHQLGYATIKVETSNGLAETCHVEVQPIIKPIENIYFKVKHFNCTLKVSITNNPEFEPNNTTYDRTLTWTSSDESIAVVDENGTVVGKSEGTVTITATTVNGISASYTITYEKPVIVITDVSIGSSHKIITVGDTYQLTATVWPEDTTYDKTVTWSSADESIATVDQTGLVTAVSPGVTTVTVRTVNDKTCTIKITVQIEQKPMTDFSLESEEITILKGQEKTIGTNILPIDTTDSREIRWESSNEEVLSVDKNGKITANSCGTVTVYARTTTGFSDSCVVHVINPITSLTLDKTKLTISVDESYLFTPTITPEDTSDYKELQWSSSDNNVVGCNSLGRITGVNPGKAIVTAKTLTGIYATCEVTVVSPITSVTLDKIVANIYEYETLQLNATILPVGASGDKTLTWTSSDTNVVTVDANGKITAINKGTAVITVTTSNGKTATCTIGVQEGRALPFNDINVKKWYYPYVVHAYKLGLMTGTTENTFAPDGNMTRGMVAVVMHRIAGTPTYSYRNIFPDVPAKKYCATAITWAFDNEIITGFKSGKDAGKFLPDGNITRQDLALILYRYATSLGIDTSGRKDISTFVDHKEVSKYAREAIEWVTSVGIITGTKENELKPQANATRAECAKMLVEFYKLVNQ